MLFSRSGFYSTEDRLMTIRGLNSLELYPIKPGNAILELDTFPCVVVNQLRTAHLVWIFLNGARPL